MHPEVIDLVTDSDSDSTSVNGDGNGNETQVLVVVPDKAVQLRESLKSKGWIEVNAKSVKEDIDRIYASEGEVWVYKSKGVDPEETAIKGNVG